MKNEMIFEKKENNNNNKKTKPQLNTFNVFTASKNVVSTVHYCILYGRHDGAQKWIPKKKMKRKHKQNM